MEQTITTVSSLKSKLFLILTLCTVISLIIIIAILIFTIIKDRQTSTQIPIAQSLKSVSKQSTFTTTVSTTTTTLSPEEIHRLSSFKEFLNLPSNHPNPNPSRSPKTMNTFMRSIYRQMYDERGSQRRKRRDNEYLNYYLSDEFDSIISLPNQYSSLSTNMTYHFEYNGSIEYLKYAEFILPIRQFSIIQLSSSTFNITIKQSDRTNNNNFIKINLTQYITSFPFTFHLTFIQTKQKLSSGFLTLYFQKSSHSIVRRDLSSFYNNQLITYPDDPSYCQVRPLRTSFSELNWSSWIIEPSSYEMNICSGTCQTQSNMGTYFIIQNLLNQKYPKKIPAPCCKPKRFSSTILLYYDGPNLILKRHENMRVVECGCSL
ncbi:unnamed protein product [Adineta steineri]|uniref:TGF-beta family profile domain-containing protein n=1 Tax=Adineta steineri TaxID=433720 RepID=A0A814Y078_9BILA|nr:unnamed protein product [Adineta steineri]CAF3849718.1 unnamed protein product [Adineta steineri]